MLTIPGSPVRWCDGLSRREFLQKRPALRFAPPVRNGEFLSPHHRMTCSVRDWELASKVASPL
jgi:hypothetical protein